MCLVLGRILGSRANSNAPLLSSNTVQWILGGKSSMRTPCARASVRSPIKGITSLRLVESAMYSASVVDMAVMVCIFDAHVMGTPANRTIQPDRDLAVMGSICAFAWRQFPAKSASTQQSRSNSSNRSQFCDIKGCWMMDQKDGRLERPIESVTYTCRELNSEGTYPLILGFSGIDESNI